MKKMIVIMLLCLSLMGCASTLTIKPDGSMIARDYTITIRKDGSKIYTPNRWFNTNFVGKILSDFLGLITK